MKKRVYYTKSQNELSERYQKANIRRVTIKLNKNTDQDLIERTEYLKSINEPIQAEIMEAWRQYLKKE